MRDINHDPKLIHTCHHGFPKVDQATVGPSIIVGRIADCIVFRMGQSDVSDAPIKEVVNIL